MNQLDFDRAFPQTPDCVRAAIEAGFRKGQRKMKLQNKIIALGSIAAAIAIMIAVAAFATGGLGTPPRPDVLAQPPVTDVPKLQEEAIHVYSTEGATFYHLKPDCSGMENALEMSEIEAVRMGKKACPVCIPMTCNGHAGEEIEFVYYAQGAKYFHKQEECNDGSFDLKGEYFTVTRAFPGKEPCPDCFPQGIEECVHERAFIVEIEPESTPEIKQVYVSPVLHEAAEKKNTSTSSIQNPVYYTTAGRYYHSDQNCNGMMNAKAHYRYDAERSNKLGCPWCLKVYCTDGGVYFHIHPDCIGMRNATLRNIQEAVNLGKKRCETCMSPATVYATVKGRYCHIEEHCSGMMDAKPLMLDHALVKYGKWLCPVCMPNPDE